MQPSRTTTLSPTIAQKYLESAARCCKQAKTGIGTLQEVGIAGTLTKLLVSKLGVSYITARKSARLQTFIRMRVINSMRQLDALEKRATRKWKRTTSEL